jgi:tRNA threonylcarbamoyladenosine biosynthesis protein TsaE
MQLISNSPEQTREIGKKLGRILEKGDVVALVGELGSGKTVLTQGLAQGLGVSPDEYISSPSFTIVNQYRGRMPMFHVDTYRLQGEPEMVALGYEEYFDPAGVTVIEWADKVRRLLPEKHVLLEFTIVGVESRQIVLSLVGDWPSGKSIELESALKEHIGK